MEAQDITLSREDLLDYADELAREVLGTDALGRKLSLFLHTPCQK